MTLKYYLKTSQLAKFLEIIIVFLTAYTFIMVFKSLAGENLILKQLIVWIANILMLFVIWLGMKLRGESFEHFRLSFKPMILKDSLKVFFKSLLVFVLAMLGFVIGSIIMANITGIPEPADMGGYDFFKGRIWVLLITLVGVYIAASFGEEVIYRAFLINRITELGIGIKYINVIAVIISSIIFGLVHFEWGPMGIVQTSFMGLALGICYILMKKRLWVLIFAHAYMDTILMVQIFLNTSN